MFENIINIWILHDIFLAQQKDITEVIKTVVFCFNIFCKRSFYHIKIVPHISCFYLNIVWFFFHFMLYNLHCIFQICRYNFTLIDNFDITDWIWLKSWRMTYLVRGYQGHAAIGIKFLLSSSSVDWVTWPVEYLSIYLFNILLSLWRKFPHRYCLFKCHA